MTDFDPPGPMLGIGAGAATRTQKETVMSSQPVHPAQPSQEELDGARQRVADRFGTPHAPGVLQLLPRDAVRDATLNMARALDGETAVLSRGDRLLIGLGVAAAQAGAGRGSLAAWLELAATVAGKTAADCEAARAVAITCATYNGYYKFRALVESKDFDAFQPALRATPFVKSQLSKALVELMCVAISVQNGCSHCVHGHVQAAREAGASLAAVDEAVRAGAVVGALAAWETASA